MQIDGQMTASRLSRINNAVLQVAAVNTNGPTDELEIHLREPISVGDKGPLAALDRLPLLVHTTGNLSQWRARLNPWIDLNTWQLAGTADIHANLTWTANACELTSLKGSVQQLQARNGTWFIDEPIVQFDVSGRYDAASRQIELVKASIESSTASLKTEKTSLTFAANKSPKLTGQLAFVADLEKLQRWTYNPQQPPAIVLAGQLGGRANVSTGGTNADLRLDAAIENFAALSTQPLRRKAVKRIPCSPFRPPISIETGRYSGKSGN